jgi:hypothetical protein
MIPPATVRKCGRVLVRRLTWIWSSYITPLTVSKTISLKSGYVITTKTDE